MKQKIATTLKQLRNLNNYTPETVVSNLQEYGIDISTKTLYGYESGLRQPKADMLLLLCKIYQVDSMNIFFDDCSFFSGDNGYKRLNSYGQKKVDDYINDLLNVEYYTEQINDIEQNTYTTVEEILSQLKSTKIESPTTILSKKEKTPFIQGKAVAKGGDQSEIKLTPQEHNNAEIALIKIIDDQNKKN